MNINEQANFIWSIADLLRGDFKQSEYGKVILPFTVLRRFDCVLAPSKAKILEANKTLTVSNKRPIFKRMTGHDYYNVSQFDFEKLMDDSNAIEANLRDYINGFSEDVREIMDNFEIFGAIDRLSRANLLYLVVQRFAEIDMSDTQIDNLEMGYMFEELIRRFSEQSNETAGEHFTPREVIELMVEVLLDPDMDEIANTDGRVITILDPACGTGGMLSVAQNKMESLNSTTQVIPFGQELNPETYATCRSDMILKGNTNSRIVLGNSFNEDGFKSQTFVYGDNVIEKHGINRDRTGDREKTRYLCGKQGIFTRDRALIRPGFIRQLETRASTRSASFFHALGSPGRPHNGGGAAGAYRTRNGAKPLKQGHLRAKRGPLGPSRKSQQQTKRTGFAAHGHSIAETAPEGKRASCANGALIRA